MVEIIDKLEIFNEFRGFKMKMDEITGIDNYSGIEIQTAFEEGIRRYIKSLWHSTSEMPQAGHSILVEYEYCKQPFYKVFDLNSKTKYKNFASTIKRWCYIDDIIGKGIDL